MIDSEWWMPFLRPLPIRINMNMNYKTLANDVLALCLPLTPPGCSHRPCHAMPCHSSRNSMVESEAWNQSVKDLVAVQATLAASGLDKIVEEYLKITVVCCLQQRVVTFTDDLGEVERYSPERHSEPIDGEPAAEWCIVVFPAFVVAGGDGGTGGEEHVVGKRLILNHQRG